MIQENPILTKEEQTRLFIKSVKCYSNGVSIVRQGDRMVENTGRHDGDKQTSPRRGFIRGFSSHAALRLRRALLESASPSPDCVCLGVTLTLPFKGDFDKSKRLFDLLVEDYKKAFHRFTVAFCRRFPASAGIFRHELQMRKAPHCHMVLWISPLDFQIVGKGRCSTINDFRGTLFGLWLNAITGFKYDVSISGFMRHGIDVQIIDSSDKIAAFRYIADHASKHKRSQLGYKGKQWGFIRRSFILPAASCQIDFRSYLEQVKFIRCVRKVCRYTIKSESSIFGNCKTRQGNLKGVYFISSRTSRRLLSAIRCGFEVGAHTILAPPGQATRLPP